MRLSGLASGMDTDMMVKEMMKAERIKVDRVEQNKQIALWRQEAFNTMNKSIANFILNTRKDLGLNKTSNTGLITSSSYKNLDYVKKASSSKETVATISSTSSGSINGSFEIEVEQLAKQDRLSVSMGKDEKFDSNIEINGVTIEAKGKTSAEVAKLINNNKELKKQNAGAFYDELTGRLFISADHTGKTDPPDSTNFLGIEVSGIKKDKNTEVGNYAEIKINGEPVVGKNITSNTIDFNGMKIDLKSENRYELDADGKIKDKPIEKAITTIKVESNVDAMMEKIEKFVEDYNALMDSISLVTSEKKYSSYKPLSQEEKKAMHEDDVKLWEQKAKSGLMNGNEQLNKMTQNIRSDMYRTVEGVSGEFNHITKIGITTEKYSKGASGGKLQIDREKLREALEADPEGVMELLFKEEGKSTTDGDKNKSVNSTMNKGVFTSMYDNMIDGMKSIIDKSGTGDSADLYRNVKSNILIDFVTKKSSISDLDKELNDMNKKIDDLNILLARKEDSYYARFTAMEKYIHKMSSQSAWIGQQMM